MSDAIWNDEQVEVYGRTFTVRELPVKALRLHLQEVVRLWFRFYRNTQALDLFGNLMGTSANVAAAETARQRAVEAEDGAADTTDRGFERIAAIVGESTGLQPVEVDKLPGSAFWRLAREVLKKQAPMVEDFLAFAGEGKAILGLATAAANGNTGAPKPSPTSSPVDSTTTTSSSE